MQMYDVIVQDYHQQLMRQSICCKQGSCHGQQHRGFQDSWWRHGTCDSFLIIEEKPIVQVSRIASG
jgi:hypothetical protein